MAIVSVCPGVQEVARYLLHRLPPEATAQLTEHLNSCAKCAAAVQSLRGRTGFAAGRPASASAASFCDTPTRIGGAVAAVEIAVGAPSESMPQPGEEKPASVPGLPPKRYAFLGPPQASDEIGRLGTYRILKALGAGGMGVVFEAEDMQLKRGVALKVMKPEYGTNDEARQRFLREARAAAAIQHDHIVTIYQVGEDRGLPYLAMQLLQGESLAARLAREKQLPIPEVLRIGREIAEGLAAAHERGVIHRDIKPGNIWLEGERGRIKILDFGLARAADDVNLTRTGTIMGTPEYMSPEQARGKGVDARSDLFSLGCVLYDMCAGQAPFHADETMAVLSALAADNPRALSELNPNVPQLLVILIMRLLAKHPDDRVATARIAADMLSEMAEVCRPAANTERTRVRKRARPISRQIVVALALAAITFGVYWYSTDAYRFITHTLYRMNIDLRIK
jgi:serine/threonine protein kinase